MLLNKPSQKWEFRFKIHFHCNKEGGKRPLKGQSALEARRAPSPLQELEGGAQTAKILVHQYYFYHTSFGKILGYLGLFSGCFGGIFFNFLYVQPNKYLIFICLFHMVTISISGVLYARYNKLQNDFYSQEVVNNQQLLKSIE